MAGNEHGPLPLEGNPAIAKHPVLLHLHLQVSPSLIDRVESQDGHVSDRALCLCLRGPQGGLACAPSSVTAGIWSCDDGSGLAGCFKLVH